jgi:hypothetical protein
VWLNDYESDATWEPASALSEKLIADYEAGITLQPTKECHSNTYGHTSTRVIMTSTPPTPQPPQKRARLDCIQHGPNITQLQ